MRYDLRLMRTVVAVTVTCCAIISAAGRAADNLQTNLPAMETFILEPIELENVAVWVPAARCGPFVNRACRPKRDLAYSSVLPADVNHTKTKWCPPEVARLLADFTWRYHQQSLPLTIFNGWQWEYSYSLCQFDSGLYELQARGGSWENSWEAILTRSAGAASFNWLEVGPSVRVYDKPSESNQASYVNVNTFSSMRTRNGYPKIHSF